MKTLRHLIAVSFVMFFALTSFAQSFGSISGKVLDKNNLHGLIAASLILYHNDVFIVGVNTGTEGNYKLGHLIPGKYVVEVRYLGYACQKREVEIRTNNEESFRLQEGLIIDEVLILGNGCGAQIACVWGCGNNVVAEKVDEEESEEEEPEQIVIQQQEALFYPNPSQGRISFKSEAVIQEMELRDVMGRLIWNKQIEGKEGSIDLSQLQTGYYIIRYGSEGVFKTKQLVKIAG